jgi:anti-anti-sigma regulatory factor
MASWGVTVASADEKQVVLALGGCLCEASERRPEDLPVQVRELSEAMGGFNGREVVLDCSNLHAVDEPGFGAIYQVFEYVTGGNKADHNFSMRNVTDKVMDHFRRRSLVKVLHILQDSEGQKNGGNPQASPDKDPVQGFGVSD